MVAAYPWLFMTGGLLRKDGLLSDTPGWGCHRGNTRDMAEVDVVGNDNVEDSLSSDGVSEVPVGLWTVEDDGYRSSRVLYRRGDDSCSSHTNILRAMANSMAGPPPRVVMSGTSSSPPGASGS